MRNYDYVIIGAGIYGHSIASELLNLDPSYRIAVIERNSSFGRSNSVLNSGVLHSGVYYTPGSDKAIHCVEGNTLLRRFIVENELYLNDCGKLIIPQSEEELVKLEDLQRRAAKNGVEAYYVDREQARELEPDAVLVLNKALYVVKAAVADPMEVLTCMAGKLKGKVDFLYEREIAKITQNSENHIKLTNGQLLTAKFLVNCAGQSALKIAQESGLFENLLQFSVFAKYNYYQVAKQPQRLIYPVPILMTLGVHLTQGKGNLLKIGPSAEIKVGDWRETVGNLATLSKIGVYASNDERSLLIKEYLANQFPNGIKRLSAIYKPAAFFNEGNKFRTRIVSRYPIFSFKTKKVVQDFVIGRQANQVHLVNFQSPGWTCALSVARKLVKQIKL